jgi:hypothetical protein
LEINPRIEIRLSGASKGNTFHSKSLIPLQPATTKKTSFVISAEKPNSWIQGTPFDLHLNISAECGHRDLGISLVVSFAHQG